jgi:hypothetical protein
VALRNTTGPSLSMFALGFSDRRLSTETQRGGERESIDESLELYTPESSGEDKE